MSDSLGVARLGAVDQDRSRALLLAFRPGHGVGSGLLREPEPLDVLLFFLRIFSREN
jgi:hypothetical protein